MELMEKSQPTKKLTLDDVEFEFRTNISVQDRFEVETAGALSRGGNIEIRPLEFYRTLIRVFVLGWSGVTEKGQSVPYSFDTFMTRVPAGSGTSLITRLGMAIAEATGIFKQEADLKNA